ncbi:hypothetical protein K435DRAFT_805138 [Dendrothele bispora CBS 962.96]|uniref:Uncharacterized protein n=1 Tax=Dendrothele bispora (strain CBS 962.96) TaxID=1314807 RepID=A0A4S8LC29_DENBC|nr:hypothetical protein K435DRAFT_805138 [Dendrothele bispora CBS 962.96]
MDRNDSLAHLVRVTGGIKVNNTISKFLNRVGTLEIERSLLPSKGYMRAHAVKDENLSQTYPNNLIFWEFNSTCGYGRLGIQIDGIEPWYMRPLVAVPILFHAYDLPPLLSSCNILMQETNLRHLLNPSDTGSQSGNGSFRLQDNAQITKGCLDIFPPKLHVDPEQYMAMQQSPLIQSTITLPQNSTSYTFIYKMPHAW